MIEQELDDMQEQIDDLKIKAAEMEGEERVAYMERVNSLEDKKKGLRERWEEVKDKGEEAWEGVKDGFEKSYKDLKDSFKNIGS